MEAKEKKYLFAHTKTTQATLLWTCLRAALSCLTSCAIIFTAPLIIQKFDGYPRGGLGELYNSLDLIIPMVSASILYPKMGMQLRMSAQMIVSMVVGCLAGYALRATTENIWVRSALLFPGVFLLAHIDRMFTRIVLLRLTIVSLSVLGIFAPAHGTFKFVLQYFFLFVMTSFVIDFYAILIPPTNASQELAEGIVAGIKLFSYHLENVSLIRQGLPENVAKDSPHNKAQLFVWKICNATWKEMPNTSLPGPSAHVMFLRGLDKEAAFERAWMGEQFFASTTAAVKLLDRLALRLDFMKAISLKFKEAMAVPMPPDAAEFLATARERLGSQTVLLEELLQKRMCAIFHAAWHHARNVKKQGVFHPVTHLSLTVNEYLLESEVLKVQIQEAVSNLLATQQQVLQARGEVGMVRGTGRESRAAAYLIYITAFASDLETLAQCLYNAPSTDSTANGAAGNSSGEIELAPVSPKMAEEPKKESKITFLGIFTKRGDSPFASMFLVGWYMVSYSRRIFIETPKEVYQILFVKEHRKKFFSKETVKGYFGKRAHFNYAFRVGIIASSAALILHAIEGGGQKQNSHSIWALITATNVGANTFGATFIRGVFRSSSTVFGGFTGFFMLWLSLKAMNDADPVHTWGAPLIYGAFTFIFIFCAVYISLQPKLSYFGAVSFRAYLSVSLPQYVLFDPSISRALWRIVYIAAGSTYSVTLHSLLLPYHARHHFEENLVAIFSKNAICFQTFIEGIKLTGDEKSQYISTLDKTIKEAVALLASQKRILDDAQKEQLIVRNKKFGAKMKLNGILGGMCLHMQAIVLTLNTKVEGEIFGTEYADMFVGLLQSYVLPIAEKINFLNALVSEWIQKNDKKADGATIDETLAAMMSQVHDLYRAYFQLRKHLVSKNVYYKLQTNFVLLFNALLFGVRHYTKQWKNVGEALTKTTSPLNVTSGDEMDEQVEFVRLLGDEEVGNTEREEGEIEAKKSL